MVKEEIHRIEIMREIIVGVITIEIVKETTPKVATENLTETENATTKTVIIIGAEEIPTRTAIEIIVTTTGIPETITETTPVITTAIESLNKEKRRRRNTSRKRNDRHTTK